MLEGKSCKSLAAGFEPLLRLNTNHPSPRSSHIRVSLRDCACVCACESVLAEKCAKSNLRVTSSVTYLILGAHVLAAGKCVRRYSLERQSACSGGRMEGERVRGREKCIFNRSFSGAPQQ